MLHHIPLNKVLLLDIETVPAVPEFDQLDDDWKSLWTKKIQYMISDTQSAADLYGRAGIYAEFGKVICISVAKFTDAEGSSLKLRSFYGDDETEVLQQFASLLYPLSNHVYLCAHNGKEFDFPFLSRRMLIQGMRLPAMLDHAGKKPWEIPHLDTMELWKFGDYKHYTSLDLLAHVFGIPTPKDEMDGSDVWRVYWQDKDLERIRTYCQKDVITTARLLLKYKGLPPLAENNIVYS
jgi:predicted PolB exonuclease-like 3'-5' exonuclease